MARVHTGPPMAAGPPRLAGASLAALDASAWDSGVALRLGGLGRGGGAFGVRLGGSGGGAGGRQQEAPSERQLPRRPHIVSVTRVRPSRGLAAQGSMHTTTSGCETGA